MVMPYGDQLLSNPKNDSDQPGYIKSDVLAHNGICGRVVGLHQKLSVPPEAANKVVDSLPILQYCSPR